MKKKICLSLFVFMLIFSSIPVMADKGYFTISSVASGSTGYRGGATKTRTQQYGNIRHTSASSGARVYVRVNQGKSIYNPCTNMVLCTSSNVNALSSPSYQKYAATGKYYYAFFDNIGSKTASVSGRYDP